MSLNRWSSRLEPSIKFNLINRENAHLIWSPTSLWYSWFPFNNFPTAAELHLQMCIHLHNLYISLSPSSPSPGLGLNIVLVVTDDQPHLQFTFHTSSHRSIFLSTSTSPSIHCTSVAVHCRSVNSAGDRLRYSHPTEDEEHAASKGLSFVTRWILQLTKNSYHNHQRVLSCLLGHSLFVVITLVTQLN